MKRAGDETPTTMLPTKYYQNLLKWLSCILSFLQCPENTITLYPWPHFCSNHVWSSLWQWSLEISSVTAQYVFAGDVLCNMSSPNRCLINHCCPDSKVHGANMRPIWGRHDPGGPHVGPMNLAIWVGYCKCKRLMLQAHCTLFFLIIFSPPLHMVHFKYISHHASNYVSNFDRYPIHQDSLYFYFDLVCLIFM